MTSLPRYESETCEFKRELTENLEKEVVAFLNSEIGGDIYIGLTDDGNILGVKNADSLQLAIIDRIKNNILPTTLGFFDVIKQEIKDKLIIKIIVSRGSEKPYYIKRYGMSPAGTYIRVGSASQQMTTEMIDRFYAARTRDSLRNIVSPRQNLSFNQLKIYYDEKGFTINDSFLENLDLFTVDGKYNYVAYLLADQNAVSIKVAKYLGSNKIDLIENEEYGFCSLIKATHRVLDKLEIENRTFTLITGAAERLQKDMVNRRALREALINAFVHNDYSREVSPLVEIFSDRLSISSYGGLVSGLSKEEFFSGRSMIRNRELMRVYKDLDLVEQLGSGMNRILKAYSKDIFLFSENFIEVSFPFEEDYLTSLNKKDADHVSERLRKDDGKIIEKIRSEYGNSPAETFGFIQEYPGYSAEEIARKMGKSARTVERNISRLKSSGYIVRKGPKLGGFWEIVDIGDMKNR